ncbi:chaplin family protein [Streptomyces sp. NPDC001380]|uniref:chaplin family protein n=1 Tax=Streptomyces sp. NPDC001380 TaxID=3364566 RepID=UPI0036B5457E
MRQAAKRGLLTAMATGSVLASTAGYAFASADAQGAAVGSPGVGSGNTVQIPVDVPVNVCGNTINVIGLLNPALGNTCANVSPERGGHDGVHGGGRGEHGGRDGRGTTRGGGADAEGTAQGSPGVLSGNTVQVPVDIPVNACGNTVTGVGLGNAAAGNSCFNIEQPPRHEWHPGKPPVHHHPNVPPVHHHPGKPPVHHRPGKPPVHHAAPSGGSTTVGHHAHEALASTGAGGTALAGTVAAGMILGGAVLYRRGRVGGR